MWTWRKPVAHVEAPEGFLGIEARLKDADRLRDEGKAVEAAEVYREVLAQVPERIDVKVQLGNMLKDAGHLGEAETLYREAQAADPDDADICVQLGHVLKLVGKRSAAIEQYRRAAAIDPSSWAATEELAQAGSSWQQQRRFEVQFRSGGAEALMRMSHQLAEMRTALDRMAEMLPDPLAQTAFPVDLYGRFREVFDVPAPPPATDLPRLTVILVADREPLDRLYAQVAGLQAQVHTDWTLLVVGRDAERRMAVERCALADQRLRWVDTDDGVGPWEAEWRAARTVADGWLVLLGRGAVLEPQALGWFAAASRLAPARAFVADQDQCRREDEWAIRFAPIFRQVVDYDTLLEANVFGETLAVEAATYATLVPQAPQGSVTRGRSRLLLALSAAGAVGHIPYALAAAPDAAGSSLSEHRVAVLAHLEAAGLADRVAVAKGETGPTYWRPRSETTRIAVIIPTRDNADDLRAFVRSLRETAQVPDALRVVIMPNGALSPETRLLVDELKTKRYATILPGVAPFNWSALNNMAAAAVDEPYLVFANDDMLMTTERWDTRVRGLLERDEVGAVGARLLFGDDTLQHAGILFGWTEADIHDGLYEAADAPGPARRWQVTRAASAVTGAFLATRRDRFQQVGGFDAVHLPVAYSDIDYALKLREAGLRVLWTPAITLRHYESKTRGLDRTDAAKKARNAAEFAAMRARWGRVLDSDPSLHPIWYPATLPFRLLAAPSAKRVADHIRRTSQPDPWAVRRTGPAGA